MKKALALVLIAMLMTMLLAGCGGGNGKLSGYFIPKDGMGVSYSSFDFDGGKVTVGLAMGTQSYTCDYEYEPGNPGTLTVTMAGSNVSIPISFSADGKTLYLGTEQSNGGVYTKTSK